jgi:hypothetical protein
MNLRIGSFVSDVPAERERSVPGDIAGGSDAVAGANGRKREKDLGSRLGPLNRTSFSPEPVNGGDTSDVAVMCSKAPTIDAPLTSNGSNSPGVARALRAAMVFEALRDPALARAPSVDQYGGEDACWPRSKARRVVADIARTDGGVSPAKSKDTRPAHIWRCGVFT